jgi:hypothetical protein
MSASKREQEQVAARRARVLQLRAAGATFQQIADAEGLASPGAAAMDVKRALHARQEQLAALVDVHVTLELERLDSAERAAQTVLRSASASSPPDHETVLKAIDRLVRISARRAGLLGLDLQAAPEKPEQGPHRRDELAEARRERRNRNRTAG